MARDLYENISLTNKYHSLANFFELFFNLADAGPEIKNYMIQSRFISRLLDIYYDRKTPNKHEMRDLSHLPLYEIFCNDRGVERASQVITPENLSIGSDEENEFDYGLRLQKRKEETDYLVVEKDQAGKPTRDDDDDLSSLVINRGNKESDEKRFAYLIRTLSILICSCKFKMSGTFVGEDSCFANTNPANEMPEYEFPAIEQLVTEKTLNDLIIRSQPTITTREAIDDMYAHLCWENDVASNSVLEIIVAEICNPDTPFSKVITQTHLISNIAKIKDRLSESRMQFLLKNIFEKSFMEEHTNYVKYADSLLNVVMEMLKRNYDACMYLRDVDGAFDYIRKFHEKHPIPIAKGRSESLFKQVSRDKIDKYLCEEDEEKLQSFMQNRLQQFDNLLVSIDFQEHIEEFVRKEEEEHVKTDMIYERGDKVDYYKEEFKFWIEATVIEDYGPILQVGYKVPKVVVNIARIEDRKSCVKINKDSVRPEGIYTEDLLCHANGVYSYIHDSLRNR